MQRTFLSIIGISLLSAMLVLPVSQASAQITFDFNNETEFDGNLGVGTTMTATDGVDSVTITTVDVLAPEYDDSLALTGVTLSALNGDTAVGTNIGSPNAIGINNLSINNSGYSTIGGAGTESNDFNPGESWVIEFDQDVVITALDFASIGTVGGESIDVTIEGGSTTNFADTTDDAADLFENPFGTTVIPAGTNITFTGAGTIADSGVRIAEIVVEVAGADDVLLGDVNQDSTVDFLDIAPFISVLSIGDFQAEADTNTDGTVDFLDISPFILLLL